VEHHRFLYHGQQAPALDQAERRRMRHVGMEAGAGGRVEAMDRRMQAEGGALHRVGALDDLAVERAEDQAGGRHLGPEIAFGIDQEQVVPAGRHEAEMIAGAGLVAEPRRPAENRRQIDAGLGEIVADHG
jgi:hypothetical protein